MGLQRIVRGTLDAEQLEGVAEAVAARDEKTVPTLSVLDADNWLSTPCVVGDRYFVKVVTGQNAAVHALFTAGRNLGAFSSGVEGFFDHVADPVELAERELEATRRMRELGVNAPEPIEAFEHEGMGVLVMEYLPAFRSLNELEPEAVRRVAPDLFDALDRLADAGLAHGDLRGENVLLVDGDLYFIDATTVRDGAAAVARGYDLACALGALAPIIGARESVALAAGRSDSAELLAAREFLDFVVMRPDHEFDAAAVKGEIEKVAVRSD